MKWSRFSLGFVFIFASLPVVAADGVPLSFGAIQVQDQSAEDSDSAIDGDVRDFEAQQGQIGAQAHSDSVTGLQGTAPGTLTDSSAVFNAANALVGPAALACAFSGAGSASGLVDGALAFADCVAAADAAEAADEETNGADLAAQRQAVQNERDGAELAAATAITSYSAEEADAAVGIAQTDAGLVEANAEGEQLRREQAAHDSKTYKQGVVTGLLTGVANVLDPW